MWTGMEMDIGWPLTEIRALHHLQVTHTPKRTCRYLRLRDFLKCWAFLLVLHHHRHQISDVNIFTKIPESSLLERKSRGQEEGCWQQHRYPDNRRHGCWKRDGKCRAAKKRKNWWQCICTMFLLPYSPFSLIFLLTIFFFLACSIILLFSLIPGQSVSTFSSFCLLSSLLIHSFFSLIPCFSLLFSLVPSFSCSPSFFLIFSSPSSLV